MVAASRLTLVTLALLAGSASGCVFLESEAAAGAGEGGAASGTDGTESTAGAGGADGTGGATTTSPYHAACLTVCGATVRSDCPTAETDLTRCTTNCEAAAAEGACSAAFRAYLACAAQASETYCSEYGGDPTALGCDEAYLTFLDCAAG